MDGAEWKRICEATELAFAHVVKMGIDDIFIPPFFPESPEIRIIRDDPEEYRKLILSDVREFLKAASLQSKGIGHATYSLHVKGDYALGA